MSAREVELFEQEIVAPDRQSSKGNQLKWKNGGYWYKADAAGYEGLAEYAASVLLARSDLPETLRVAYEPVAIRYRERLLRGAVSRDFRKPGQQLLTAERLFQQKYGESLYQSVFRIRDHAERLRFLVESMERITGLRDLGVYMSRLLTLDAVILNEDRHAHNIAFLRDEDGSYELCPFFDHGAGLLSDTTIDYPLEKDVFSLMDHVKAKTVSEDFDEQLDLAEELYGEHLKFHITGSELHAELSKADLYTEAERERVETVLREQMRKYAYLFL